ncbi:hypothetical protein BD309DRAFT_970974 [Dichomitus squalens]|uniref:F-box domain-containing protein n=1 Tax=Dichomitus squalens TaxID=114155 RepID=A0A4Q9NE61_9APHY|nr:hypothetical protein BD309DRAFT_970974 [Dichomitus squalens]TBU57317.1 hypothetical protein BD310DRAFT_1039872 [Dichomitus squalens]
MAQSHPTILELVESLANKTLQNGSDEEFLRLSARDIESSCRLLPRILASVRRASNSRRPVNTLPPEILLRIFAFIPPPPELTVFDTIEGVCGPFGIRKVWELRAITQVCYKWRSLALNVSDLWSSAFRVPHWGSRCGDIPNNACHHLYRCVAGPIHLYAEEDGLTGVNWQKLRDVDAPLDFEDRVEELHVLTLDGWRKHGSLPTSLSSPRMRALRKLVVRSLHSGNAGATSWEWQGLQSLFAEQTPPLRSLAIIDSPFLPLNPLPTLTRLVLFYQMKREMRDTWSLHDLMHFLSDSPTLEELIICGIPYDSVSGGRLSTARLGNLRKLSIRAWDYRTPGRPGLPLLLFSHLIIPQTCYLRLDVGSVEQLAELTSHLRTRLWDVPVSNVHFLLGASPYTLSSLQATFPSSGGGIRVDIPTVQGVDPSDELADAIYAFLTTPPFAAAGALWLSGLGIDSACQTRTTSSLRAFSGVKKLYVAAGLMGDQEEFVKSLGDPMSLPDSAQLPFPNLDTLYVFVDDDYGLAVGELADMLRRRVETGCKVKHLLVGCVGPEDGGPASALRKEIESLIGTVVEDVTVLGEDGYGRMCGLRTVLPLICTAAGGGLVWVPWTENETTFSLIHTN